MSEWIYDPIYGHFSPFQWRHSRMTLWVGKSNTGKWFHLSIRTGRWEELSNVSTEQEAKTLAGLLYRMEES